MRERLKRHAWKACVLNGTLGSNPSLSAILLRQDALLRSFGASQKRRRVFTLGFAAIGGSSSKLREERSRLRQLFNEILTKLEMTTQFPFSQYLRLTIIQKKV